jgi:anti-anti-sigma factor
MSFLPDPDDVHSLKIETIEGEDVAWVILQGEADIATLRDLEVALDQVELDDIECVHLDLSELRFADVSTIRGLAFFAKRVKQSGRNIEALGANPTLRMVARLCDTRDDLGLT